MHFLKYLLQLNKNTWAIVLIIVFGLMMNSKFSSVHAQNNVLDFDGINDYVQLDSVTPALVGSQSYTIELWMRADRFAQNLLRPVLFSINKSATFNINAQNILLITFGNSTVTDGLLSISTIAGGAGVNTGINIGDNLCHHVAYVNPGTGSNSGLIYVDGVLALANLTTPPALTITDRISLGQEFDGAIPSQFYKGEIDNVRIWSTAKTQAEIQADILSQLTGTEPNLVALYHFNQGIPGGNNTTIANLFDQNLPSNNGYFINFNLYNSSSNFVQSTCLPCINVFTNQNLTACESSLVTFPDGTTQVITANISHTSNLLTTNGCDSIITSNVQMLLSSMSSTQDSLCSGTDFTFPDGVTHTNIVLDEVYVSTIMNSAGCDSIISTTLNLYPIISMQENVLICYGSNYTFPDGTVHTNIITNENYSSTLTNSIGCDSIVITFIEVRPQILTVENIELCSGFNYTFHDGTVHINITLNESYTSIFTSSSGCDSLIQTNISVLIIPNQNENVSVCQNSDYTFPDGTTHYNLTNSESYTSVLLSSQGCDSAVITYISIEYPPIVNLGADIEKCEGKSVVLSVAQPSSSYVWNNGETTNSISINIPGLYSVVVTNNCGTVSSSVDIKDTDCNCNIFLPNTFSPNGDEYNHTFGPVIDCDIDAFLIEIYNRWGNLIYKSKSIFIPWDGTYNGQIVLDGLYTYKVTYSTETIINKVIIGHVNVLR